MELTPLMDMSSMRLHGERSNGSRRSLTVRVSGLSLGLGLTGVESRALRFFFAHSCRKTETLAGRRDQY
jgi:hypothetical protein